MRWQEAQERCRQSLRGRECELVLSFTGPDQLAADLQRREQEFSDNLRRQLIAQIYPYLRFVQMLSGVFLSVMRPTSIETALLWGVLHLAINVCHIDSRYSVCVLNQSCLAGFCRLNDKFHETCRHDQ